MHPRLDGWFAEERLDDPSFSTVERPTRGSFGDTRRDCEIGECTLARAFVVATLDGFGDEFSLSVC